MLTLRSSPAEGVVLKRSNVGEADRIVTVLTKEHGKIAGVAKGVRKVTSSKKSYLEPGNHVRIFLIKTKSMPIITQASLLHQAIDGPTSLRQYRSLVQWLEIINAVFVEEELTDELYELVLATRLQCLAQPVNVTRLQKQLALILEQLGFNEPQGEKAYSITQFVNTIADHPLNGFDYLSVH